MHKDDLVKSAIVKAALEQFRRYGIVKTTMEDIASAAGKGKSTLYYYFKDKEEVLLEGAKQELREINTAVSAAVRNVATMQEKFDAFMITRFTVIREKATIYYQAFNEIRQHRNWTMWTDLTKLYRDEEVQLLRKMIDESVAQGGSLPREGSSLSDADIMSISSVCIAALHGLEVIFVEEMDTFDGHFEEHLKVLSHIFFKGLTA